MNSLWYATDYRAWLREWLGEQKASRPWISLRWLAHRIEMDPSTLAKVLQGDRHIGDASIPILCEVLKLDAKESAYFATLVEFSKAKTALKSKAAFERLMQLRRGLGRQIGEDQAEFYESWHHAAVRLALTLHECRGDWEALGARLLPPLSGEDVEASIAVLDRLGMIALGEDGVWRPKDAFIHSGSAWKGPAVRHHQAQMLLLAADSLSTVPKEWRDVSTVTISIPQVMMPVFREKVAEFRSLLLSMTRELDHPDTIMQVCVALFPLTAPPAAVKR